MLPQNLGRGDALLVVDVQNDFCPGGALPVPRGDQVVPVLNEWIAHFAQQNLLILFSRCWHPPDHISFVTRGGPWPVHCVRGTYGARFHRSLTIAPGTVIVSKGQQPDQEQYSGLEVAGLVEKLRHAGIKRLWMGGLALDVCVRASALQAVHSGFETHLLRDASRAVETEPGDGDRTVLELHNEGVVIEDSRLAYPGEPGYAHLPSR